MRAQFWDAQADRPILGRLYFLLPIEILASLITEVDVAEWCEFALDQGDLLNVMTAWCERMGIIPLHVLAMGLWGDSAPYDANDSLYLFLF